MTIFGCKCLFSSGCYLYFYYSKLLFVYSGNLSGYFRQETTTIFLTGNYNHEPGSMTGILEHLKWVSLKKRWKDSRLILLYKGLKGKASIPTDDLIPMVRHCRNHHSSAS